MFNEEKEDRGVGWEKGDGQLTRFVERGLGIFFSNVKVEKDVLLMR